MSDGDGGRKPVWGRIANAKSLGWAIYAVGFCDLAFWLFERRPRPTIRLERDHAVVDFQLRSQHRSRNRTRADVREHDSNFTLGSLIPLRALSRLGGRDIRVVGVFGVADLALGTVASLTMQRPWVIRVGG
jgi:hypothetical protein